MKNAILEGFLLGGRAKITFSKYIIVSGQCTEVHFASLLSGGFTTMAVINPPEKKLENLTSVQ